MSWNKPNYWCLFHIWIEYQESPTCTAPTKLSSRPHTANTHALLSLLSWHATPPRLGSPMDTTLTASWESSISWLEPFEIVIAKKRHAGSQASEERHCEGNGCAAGLVDKRKHCRGGARKPWYRGSDWRIL